MKYKRSLSLTGLLLVSVVVMCAGTIVSAAQSNSANVHTPSIVGAPPLLAGTGPAVCTEDSHTQDVFVTGADHALYWSQYTDVHSQGSWTKLGGYLTSSPAATAPRVGWIQVYARGSDGALYAQVTSGPGTYFQGWFKL